MTTYRLKIAAHRNSPTGTGTTDKGFHEVTTFDIEAHSLPAAVKHACKAFRSLYPPSVHVHVSSDENGGHTKREGWGTMADA